MLAAGLVLRVPAVVPVAIALLGLQYVAILVFESDVLDARAPLVAAAMLAVSELAYWSLELRSGLTDEPGTYLRQVSLLAALALVTVALGTGVLALVELVGARGIAIDVAGALAAILAIGLLAFAASHRIAP